MTRSNFDLSRTIVDYLEQSKPSQTIWEQQNYQTPPGNIWDHLKPFRNISDQLKQYQSISDQLWQSLTISDHLATSQTISDQVCPSMTISAHLGPSHFSPHLKPSLNIGPSLTICLPSATTSDQIGPSWSISDFLGLSETIWDHITSAGINSQQLRSAWLSAVHVHVIILIQFGFYIISTLVPRIVYVYVHILFHFMFTHCHNTYKNISCSCSSSS